MVLTLQCAYFRPFPDKYVELSDTVTAEYLYGIKGLVTQKGGRRKYRNIFAIYFYKETMDFLNRLIKLDPRDRPSAQDLLQDR